MSTLYNSKTPQIEYFRDLDSYEEIIHSWGYQWTISKIVAQDGVLWFWCDGMRNSCPDQLKDGNMNYLDNTQSADWDTEGVSDKVSIVLSF